MEVLLKEQISCMKKMLHLVQNNTNNNHHEKETPVINSIF